MKKILINIGIVILGLVGLAILSYAIFKLNDYSIKNKKYVEVKATIIEYDMGNSSIDMYVSTLFNDKIVFSYDVNGIEYKTKYELIYNKYSARKGKTTKIKYNPEDPNEIIWASDHSYIFLLILGLAFTLTALIRIISDIKERKTSKAN